MNPFDKGIQRLNATAASINTLWSDWSSSRDPRYVVVVLWALLTVPLIFLRGYNSDEGLLVTIARTALEDGNWITPHAFNARIVERPTLIAPGLCVTAVLIAYGLGYALIAAPLLPERFRSSMLDANRITDLVSSAPATIYKADIGLNVFPYVPGRIIQASASDLDAVKPPAWIATTRADANNRFRPRQVIGKSVAFGRDSEWLIFQLLEAKPE